MKNHLRSGILLLLFALTLTPALSFAASVSVTPLRFPTVSPGQTSYGTATITVNATNGTPYNVTIDAGAHLFAGLRRVQNTSGVGTQYYLYKNAGMTQLWGDSDFANTYLYGSSVAGTGTGENQDLTVYGYISTPVGMPTGSYSDQVTVTVIY